MDSSDFLKKQEEDKDIKLFKEEHPDVYKFIVRLIDGQCDDKRTIFRAFGKGEIDI